MERGLGSGKEPRLRPQGREPGRLWGFGSVASLTLSFFICKVQTVASLWECSRRWGSRSFFSPLVATSLPTLITVSFLLVPQRCWDFQSTIQRPLTTSPSPRGRGPRQSDRSQPSGSACLPRLPHGDAERRPISHWPSLLNPPCVSASQDLQPSCGLSHTSTSSREASIVPRRGSHHPRAKLSSPLSPGWHVGWVAQPICVHTGLSVWGFYPLVCSHFGGFQGLSQTMRLRAPPPSQHKRNGNHPTEHVPPQ